MRKYEGGDKGEGRQGVGGGERGWGGGTSWAEVG